MIAFVLDIPQSSAYIAKVRFEGRYLIHRISVKAISDEARRSISIGRRISQNVDGSTSYGGGKSNESSASAFTKMSGSSKKLVRD
jgi:hypothetical protein